MCHCSTLDDMQGLKVEVRPYGVLFLLVWQRCLCCLRAPRKDANITLQLKNGILNLKLKTRHLYPCDSVALTHGFSLPILRPIVGIQLLFRLGVTDTQMWCKAYAKKALRQRDGQENGHRRADCIASVHCCHEWDTIGIVTTPHAIRETRRLKSYLHGCIAISITRLQSYLLHFVSVVIHSLILAYSGTLISKIAILVG